MKEKETSVEFDYCCVDSAIELAHQFEIEFQGAGWYRQNNCTILIVHWQSLYKAYVWDGIDPRELFTKLLDLPVYSN